MNNQPNYILKTNEAVLVPYFDNTILKVLNIFTLSIVALISLVSIVYKENFFLEMSVLGKITIGLIILAVLICNIKKKEVPSPIELQFYDDYFILYLPKRYYSKRVTRKEVNKMMYSDISKCVYKANAQRIHIYGNGSFEFYNYNKKEGTVPQIPTKIGNYQNGLLYFNTSYCSDINIVDEISKHSPIKVNVEYE